jgi:hypothetical protein
MKAHRLLIVLALLLGSLACQKNDPAACATICARGLTLAKQTVTEQLKGSPQSAANDAMAEWKKQEARLRLLQSSCVERCVREPDPAVIGCLQAAKSFQSFESCTK